MQIPVRAELTQSCPRPDKPDPKGLTVGALAFFSVLQEGALGVCDARREELVNNQIAFNKIVEQVSKPVKPWWHFW